MELKNIIGNKYGFLTVVEELPRRKKYIRIFRCLCDCGNYKELSYSNLTTGHTVSCGCYWLERIKNSNSTHRLSKTPTYNSWHNMINRCYIESHEAYKYYGGRGITVCDRWLNSIENFIEDMGYRPKGKTLDRIDNNKSYSKENCRWATPVQQLNNRRCSVFYEYNGERKTIKEWSIEKEIPYDRLRERIKKLGWSIEKALTTPKLS